MSDEARTQRIAKGLRDFGYPDVTPAMVAEVFEAMERGDEELPHGVIGMMIESLAKS